jgi:peptide/nickel transport system substrate-binding protein
VVHTWLRRPTLWVLAPFLIILLVAAACGGDATEVPATSVPATSVPAPATSISTAMPEPDEAMSIPTAMPEPDEAMMMTSSTKRLRFATQAPWIEIVLPWRGGSWGSNLVVRTHMESLIDVHNETTELVPNLATEWRMITPQEWEFKLREGVPFHKTGPNSDDWGDFRAADVAHVIARNSESNLSTDGPAFRAKFGSTEGEVMTNVEIIDEHTIKLKPVTPDVDLDLTASSQYGNFLMHAKAQWDAVGAEGSEADPAGTGSYQLVDRKLGVWLLWERVQDHWRQTPEFEEFEILLVPEHATRLAMLLGGEIAMTEIPRDLHPEAVSQGYKVWSTINPMTQAFGIFGGGYGEDTPEFDADMPASNPKIRQAINMAIDRDALATEVFKGVGEPLYVQAFHERLPAWNPRWAAEFDEKYGYDPEGAKQLIKDAGFPNGFSFKLWLMQFPGFPETTAITEAIFNYLRDVGIDAEIEEIEVARHREFYNARDTHGTLHFRRTSFTTPMVTTRWYNARPPTGNATAWEFPVEQQSIWDQAFVADTKVGQADLLTQLGNWKYDNFSEVPLFWLPGQAVVDPEIISEYIWPGNVDAGFDHFEYIKAAN